MIQVKIGMHPVLPADQSEPATTLTPSEKEPKPAPKQDAKKK